MNSTPASRESLYQELLLCRNTINNILNREFNHRESNNHNYSSQPYYIPPPVHMQYGPYNPYYMTNYYHPYFNSLNNNFTRNSSIPIYQPYARRNTQTSSNQTRNPEPENRRNNINSLINILDHLNSIQSRYRNSTQSNSSSNTNDSSNNTEQTRPLNESENNHENQNENINNDHLGNRNRTNNRNYQYNFIPQFNSLLNPGNRTNPDIYQNLDPVIDTSPYQNTTNWNETIIDTSPHASRNRFRERIRQVLPELVEITLYSDGTPVNTDLLQDVEVPTNLSILRNNTTVSSYANLNTTEDRCCICRENFRDTDIVRKINSCGHVFHINCVDTWLESNTTCPMCRHDIRESITSRNENDIEIESTNQSSNATTNQNMEDYDGVEEVN